MNNFINSNEMNSSITLDEAPGKTFIVDGIDFSRTTDAQILRVEVDSDGKKVPVTLQTENTEEMERLVVEFMEKAQAVCSDVTLNFAELVWDYDDDNNLHLALSLTLPANVGILSDEGFKLQELGQLLSENSGNPLSLEFSEFRRGNVLPLKLPAKFQSRTFEFHQKMMWARMALEGLNASKAGKPFEVQLRKKHEKKIPILRQVIWKIDTPKTREYSAIVIITIVTYFLCVALCVWIESLKR